MGEIFEKLVGLSSGEISSWKQEAVERQNSSDWSECSFKIAVRILREIRTQNRINGMTQKKLADEMGVSPQYVNKIVKGKENPTLETISKIEKVLGIALIEVPFDDAEAGDFQFRYMASSVSDCKMVAEDEKEYGDR